MIGSFENADKLNTPILGQSFTYYELKDEIKDVNDAVVKYGKLPTLLSILSSATTSKIKIELRKKQLVKRIRT